MVWWSWLLVGLALLALEVTTPGGFYFLFFGVAALVVGALAGAGLGEPAWVDWLLFSVLSVASLVLFRGRLLGHLKTPEAPRGSVGELVGEVAVLLDDLAPGAVAKAELRGTAWNVRTSGAERLARGRRCRVERVEGLTLWVRPE
jgi:membrane protein implicated in regulation of membrane protease activity